MYFNHIVSSINTGWMSIDGFSINSDYNILFDIKFGEDFSRL